MRIRRNVLSLNSNERKQLTDAFLRLKKNGKYDAIVAEHKKAMMRATPMPGENPDHARRNAAHCGPIFLPWHREYLLRLEKELDMPLPYWDWTVDAASPDPTKSDIWGTDLLGGNGVASNWWANTGSFAKGTGDWDIPNNQDGPALTRRFGAYPGHPDQATRADVALAFSDPVYDQSPWDRNAALFSFRNRIEGWVSKAHDPRIRTSGSQTHNRIHLWVGGRWTKSGTPVNGSMVRSTSPNDPVFFLHHAFVDKIWSDWQAWRQKVDPGGAPHYAPKSGGPAGHNIGDAMFLWTTKIQDVFDHKTLGYEYDTVTDWSQYLPAIAAEKAAPEMPLTLPELMPLATPFSVLEEPME